MKIKKIFAFVVAGFFLSSVASADWVWSPEQGKFINTQSETQGDANDVFDNALDLYKEKKLDKAVEQFELLLKKYPKSQVAPEAQYRLGTIYEEQADLVKAHNAYQALIKAYPQSERFEEVIEREYEIGMAFLAGKKGKMLGLDVRPSLPLAIEVFKKIVEESPYGPFGDKAQFQLGVGYQKSGKYDESLEAFQTMIAQYPQSPLVQQARLQLTEVSYLKSSSLGRDQGALDAAAQQAKRYLASYPDSEEAERAAKINQQIDELNAEKNYRIGLFYEKDNYLESALIYYRDTANRYPNTQWGIKAADKLKSLEEPVKYLNAQTDELQAKLKDLEEKYQALGKDQKTERAQLKKDIDQLKKSIRRLGKHKSESLDRRRQDLKRRERELKEKFKDLERKKKRYKNNTSPDFQKAVERWQASLEAERDALAEEKDKLELWRGELGVPPSGKFYEGLENLIPFVGAPETLLEKIQKMDEKELYKLARQKKELLDKKEKLYKRYSELQKNLTPERSPSGLVRKRLRALKKQDASQPVNPILEAREKEIESLEKQLEEKKALYEKYFGKQAEMELEAQLEQRAGVKPVMNPFALETGDLKAKSLEELLELKMHLEEQITNQRNVVETLSTAFDKELALKEQEQLMKALEKGTAEPSDEDKMKLRKKIKSTEKELRVRYQDIQDRDKKKNKLLEELDQTLHPHEEKGSLLRTMAKPFTGIVYFAKAFISGLPNQDEELTQEAKKQGAETRAQTIQEAIELESLMIQADQQEATKLEKELEILNARASLEGGMAFRSSLIKVPYVFIDEAVQSARRIVPKKNRKDVLLNRLDKQTKELEILKSKLDATQAIIDEKTKTEAPAASAPAAPDSGAAGEPKPEEKELRDTVIGLQEQLEVSYSKYAQEQGLVLGEISEEELPEGSENAKAYHELQEVKKELVRMVDQELGLEQREKNILEMRIQEVEKVMPTVTSKAMQENLQTEKGRMQQRLSDLAIRHDFLTKERERFGSPLA